MTRFSLEVEAVASGGTAVPPEARRRAKACVNSVATGVFYPSAGEVVRAGLRARQERDGGIERWLREEVAPTYDAVQGDPSRAVPVDQVSQNLRAYHQKRLKAKRGV